MNVKKTLAEHVYGELKEQIVSGRLKYGDRLPSMNSLCVFYNVGIRTVKDVMRRLKEEGYIRTEERKAAAVIYKAAPEDSGIHSVLQRKTSILAVHETIYILIPLLLSFSASLFAEEELRQMTRRITTLRRRHPKASEQACRNCIYTMLERSHNLLFRDLFSSLETYARLPFFQDHGRFLELVQEYNEFDSTAWVMDSIPSRDAHEITRRFRLMFKAVSSAIRRYLDEMHIRYGDVLEETSVEYAWAAERGRDHYYTQIVRDLINKIGTGFYKEGAFLPSEAALARQYKVSVSTVRRALSMLGELGFSKTLNDKGTVVFLQSDSSTFQCMKNKTYRRDTMLYLSGVQLMAIAVHPAALLAFDHIDRQTIQKLRQRTSRTGSIPLADLTRCVIDNQTLKPMKTILQELEKLMNWGYYFSFFSEGPSHADLLTKYSLTALEHLAGGRKDAFASSLSECYCHILSFVRDFMSRCGLPEAAGLLTPGIVSI